MARRWDRDRPTLAERSGQVAAPSPAEAPDPATRRRPVGTRHCWVALPASPGRCAGVLVEWRRDDGDGAWLARVAYVVEEAGSPVLVEAWVAARHLRPAP